MKIARNRSAKHAMENSEPASTTNEFSKKFSNEKNTQHQLIIYRKNNIEQTNITDLKTVDQDANFLISIYLEFLKLTLQITPDLLETMGKIFMSMFLEEDRDQFLILLKMVEKYLYDQVELKEIKSSKKSSFSSQIEQFSFYLHRNWFIKMDREKKIELLASRCMYEFEGIDQINKDLNKQRDCVRKINSDENLLTRLSKWSMFRVLLLIEPSAAYHSLKPRYFGYIKYIYDRNFEAAMIHLGAKTTVEDSSIMREGHKFETEDLETQATIFKKYFIRLLKVCYQVASTFSLKHAIIFATIGMDMVFYANKYQFLHNFELMNRLIDISYENSSNDSTGVSEFYEESLEGRKQNYQIIKDLSELIGLFFDDLTFQKRRQILEPILIKELKKGISFIKERMIELKKKMKTISWEFFLEGIDDEFSLTTLQNEYFREIENEQTKKCLIGYAFYDILQKNYVGIPLYEKSPTRLSNAYRCGKVGVKSLLDTLQNDSNGRVASISKSVNVYLKDKQAYKSEKSDNFNDENTKV